jgi:hypothetical protein
LTNSAVVKLNIIAKICKYKKLHEEHHFISMAMEVHGTFGHNMDCSSRSVLVFSMIDDQKVIYPYLFVFNFLGNMLVLLFNVL